MVMMDQFTRRVIGFSVHKGDVDGLALCCMFNKIISNRTLPKRLSSDNDPLFTFQKWQANLRILEVEEIKSISYTPISHPFVERLIRTIREELLNNTLIWNQQDLQKKLDAYQDYFNQYRSHSSIHAMTPENKSSGNQKVIGMNHHKWKKYLRGLIQLPIAI
jgi:transposase InsO family protein